MGQEVPPEYWYLFAVLLTGISRMTLILMFTAKRTSDWRRIIQLLPTWSRSSVSCSSHRRHRNIALAFGNHGTFNFRSGDWELVESGQKETPLQKYQRLQCEMKELLEEVAQLKVRD
jgi:hypothetical protein